MIKNLAIGSKSNRAFLVLALFLGLLAAVLTAVYLSSAGGGGSGSGGGSGATVPVVVATQEVAAGTRLSADMITVKPVATDVAIPNAFGSSEDVVGKVTRLPLAANEQVSQAKLASGDFEFGKTTDLPLALVVPEGMRGVSATVSTLIGAGGLIRPGDRVDVILSVKMELKDQNGGTLGRTQIARTILQDAQVLAIDQTVAPVVPNVSQGEEATTDSGQLPLSQSDSKPDAVTVTLALAPVHGEVLALAETCASNYGGRLSLALRGFGDEGTVPARAIYPLDGPSPDCADLFGLDYLQ